MAQDITKNSSDIENYSKEFVELQSQLNQVSKEKFNGISLFASSNATAAGTLTAGTGSYNDGTSVPKSYNTYGRTLLTHDSGESEAGSISINVVNFQFMLSVGTIDSGNGATNIDLGNINGANTGTGITSSGFISDITDVAVSQFTSIIERIADMRAENGAEQNRVLNTMDLLQSNLTNIEAAHGRIMDTDIALESTRFARHNVLVQASAAMTAQANQLTNVALQLLG
jgi:flagellin